MPHPPAARRLRFSCQALSLCQALRFSLGKCSGVNPAQLTSPGCTGPEGLLSHSRAATKVQRSAIRGCWHTCWMDRKRQLVRPCTGLTAVRCSVAATTSWSCARRAVVCWVDRVRQECDAGWPRKCVVFLASDSGVVRAGRLPAGLSSCTARSVAEAHVSSGQYSTAATMRVS